MTSEAPSSSATAAHAPTRNTVEPSGSRSSSPAGSISISFRKEEGLVRISRASSPGGVRDEDDESEADIVIVAGDEDSRSQHQHHDQRYPPTDSAAGSTNAATSEAARERQIKEERRMTLPPSPPLTVEGLGEHKDEHAFARMKELDEEDIAHALHEPEPSSATRTFEVVRNKQPSLLPYRKPRSSYYIGPPGSHTAFGTPQVGQIGVHDPREIVRIERDYQSGELPQFSPTYPLEFEGRITATQFIDTINTINELLISAHSLRRAALDNALAAFTLYISTLVYDSWYEKEMRRLATMLDKFNTELYNPRGLNILWPRRSAFLFLEIEYY